MLIAVGRRSGSIVRPGFFSLVLSICGLLAASCATSGRTTKSEAVVEAPAIGMTTDELQTRRLFRVSLSGTAGEGSMRLALSLPRADSYSISASDPFGRALWDLVVGPEVSFLVDHRRGRYCDLNSEVGVPQATLEEFSLRSLPSVLLGYLPVRPPEKIDEEADAIDFVDESDRRWTARIEAGRVVSWTLWLEGEPFVWWSRRQRGGILSHRRGSQLRWRQTLSEVLSDDYRPPPIPRGYESIVCDESDLPTWGAAGATAEGPEG